MLHCYCTWCGLQCLGGEGDTAVGLVVVEDHHLERETHREEREEDRERATDRKEEGEEEEGGKAMRG